MVHVVLLMAMQSVTRTVLSTLVHVARYAILLLVDEACLMSCSNTVGAAVLLTTAELAASPAAQVPQRHHPLLFHLRLVLPLVLMECVAL